MENSPTDRPQITPLTTAQRSKARPKSAQQSRITNGKLLPGDNRGRWVRRCSDLIGMYLADLGGEDNCSTAEQSIIRRVSVLSVELEALEQKFALAGSATPTDLDLYGRTAGNLRRLLETIGIERRAKTVPSFGDLLREDHVRQQAENKQFAEKQRREFEVKQQAAFEAKQRNGAS